MLAVLATFNTFSIAPTDQPSPLKSLSLPADSLRRSYEVCLQFRAKITGTDHCCVVSIAVHSTVLKHCINWRHTAKTNPTLTIALTLYDPGIPEHALLSQVTLH